MLTEIGKGAIPLLV